MLKDSFNRTHDYLRISLTDNCNFRCVYCMPNEKIKTLPKSHLIQSSEIFDIAKTFVDLGVKKIRFTGGEPLIRKDFKEILNQLSLLPVELCITTNGFLLDEYIQDFIQSGIRSVNISIDSLNAERFFKVTQRNAFSKVWNNILLAFENGLHVKLNVVLMKNFNEDEVFDFVNLTKDLPIHIRFIEFMPFDKNQWNKDRVVSNQDVLHEVQQAYSLFKLEDRKNDTDKKFGIFGHAGTISFISTLSDYFCGNCNRLRLTADGKMKNCLFGKDEFDLLKTFREGNDIMPIIQLAVQKKHAKLGGQFEDYQTIDPEKLSNRSMIKIGG